MTYFLVDDNFSDHPKTEGLSLASIGLWTLVGSWCGRFSNKGTFSEERVRKLGGTKRQVNELVSHGLWERCEEGYRFHDFNGNGNPTAEEVAERRALRSNAGRKGGIASGKSRRSKTEANNKAKRSPSVREATKQTGTHNRNHNHNQTLLSKDKSERDPLPTNEQIRKWEPKPEHRQQVMEMVDKGYPLIDLDNLAKEFRSSLLSKGIDHYQYRDLDAAFDTWILKRAQSKRDQHQSETINQDTALASGQWHEPHKEPERKPVYGIGSKRVLDLLGLQCMDPTDWRSLAVRDLLNEGKSDEEALSELGQMERLRNEVKETEAVS